MAYRWLGVLALLAVGSIGCENSESGDARGTGGVGGDDGSQIPCVTSTLCLACPSGPQCDTSQDCAAGFACIESGCDDLDGAPINQCVFAGGGACESDAECSSDRKCIEVPGEEVMRCVKTTPGCDADSDCVLGFSCEESSCVDRRVPCILDADCPKSHFCYRFDATGFCRRMHQSCDNEFDCAGIAPRCDNVDGDGDVEGTTECAGTFNPNAVPPQACLNSMCSGATPVCEVGEDSGFTDCGQYGLCRDAADCADGFECVALWLDGRSECVPVGGSCSHITDCPARQVCASPRDGGAPECQAGYQPL